MAKAEHGLHVGTQIDHYRIEQVLGAGGFSIVYLATDIPSGQQVVVKEYLPQKLAYRSESGAVVPREASDESHFKQGRHLFLHEARTLATLRHPNIVAVTNFFSTYGTVYMVMEYAEGVNLQKYLREHNGGMSERFLRKIFPELLDGLKHIHSKGLLHLDIKPGNIHIRPGGAPILLDFGAVHQQQISRANQRGQVISPGFSPPEQCQQGGYVGPWTDLYAIGASMRTCIEGQPPIPALERLVHDRLKPATQAFKRRYSQALLEAIDWAMEPDPLLRPQSVDEFLFALEGENGSAAKPEQSSGQEAIMDWINNNLIRFRGPASTAKKDEEQ